MFLASLVCAALFAASVYYELAQLSKDGTQQGLMLMLLEFIPA